MNEQEKKILEQMDVAMAEKETEKTSKQEQENKDNPQPKKQGLFADKTPNVLHCRRCRTEMKDGVCPTCGFKMYVPMDESKRKNIRLVLGGICLVGFVLLLLFMK